VASLSQGRTAAAQCGLFTHKSVPVIFEPPCIFTATSHDHCGLEGPGFVSLEGQDISFSPKLPDWPCSPSILLFNRFRSSVPGVMRPDCEVNHSHPSITDVKNECTCTSTPTVRLYGVDRDNFTFPLHHRTYTEDVTSPE